MLELQTVNNEIIIDCPYSTEYISKIRNLKDRRFDFKTKTWRLPLQNALELYNAFPSSEIKPDETIQKFVNSQNGRDLCFFRRIALDTFEVSYPYHQDIDVAISEITNKYSVDVNCYTMPLKEAQSLIDRLGKNRCRLLTTRSPHEELYSVNREKLNLNFREPVAVFTCSDSYGSFLMKEIATIGKDYKNWCYKIPIHSIPTLIGLVGNENVVIPEEIRARVEQIYKKEIPTKERLKNIKPIAEYHLKTKLLPHQIEAFNAGIQNNRLLIADSPGLGKTLSSIAIASYRSQENQSALRNCLIICGVNSVKYNWQAEIEKHSYEKAIVIDGTAKKRLELIDKWQHDRDTLFGIINIESLRNEEILKKLNSLTSMVIVDEIHKAKNGQTKQGKALRALDCAEIRIGLSGTPMTNKPEDLWNILSWLGIENRNVWSFRNRYCIKGGYEDKEIVGTKNLQDLALELKEVMLRRTKEEVIDLPPKIHKSEYVELTDAEKKDYKDAEKGVLEHLDEILHTTNPLTSLLRMRQVTSGLYASQSENAKLKRLSEIMEESIIPEGNKAIIFTQYEQVADLYRKALSKYNPAYIVGNVSVENRQNEVERFQNDPDCKIAIGTIGAMGTGHTMTAASYVFFVDKDWAQTNNDQAEDRAHRIGTSSTITVISLIAKNTIDERIETILQQKADLFDAIVNGKAIDMQTQKEMFLSLLPESKIKNLEPVQKAGSKLCQKM